MAAPTVPSLVFSSGESYIKPSIGYRLYFCPLGAHNFLCG